MSTMRVTDDDGEIVAAPAFTLDISIDPDHLEATGAIRISAYQNGAEESEYHEIYLHELLNGTKGWMAGGGTMNPDGVAFYNLAISSLEHEATRMRAWLASQKVVPRPASVET